MTDNAFTKAEQEQIRKIIREEASNVSRRGVLAASAGLAGLGVGAYSGSQRASAQEAGSGTIGTPENPLDAIYVEDLNNTTNSITADTISTDVLNSADLQNAASGTVPVSQGDGTLSMGESSGLWRQDSGSPYTESGSSSIDISVDEFDWIMVMGTVTDTASNSDDYPRLRVNSDDGSNYSKIDYSGTTTTGESSFPYLVTLNIGGTAHFMFTLMGYGSGNILLNNLSGGSSSAISTGRNNNASHPVTDITLLRDESADWEVEVYGRGGSGN